MNANPTSATPTETPVQGEYRVLICGDRDWSDRIVLGEALLKIKRNILVGEVVIVEGACRGADAIGGELGAALGFAVEEFPARWDLYGRNGGPIRNREMIDSHIDLALVFHDNLTRSRGTADMVEKLVKAKVPMRFYKSREARRRQA